MSQNAAWLKILEVLDEVSPGWDDKSMPTDKCAVEAIYALAGGKKSEPVPFDASKAKNGDVVYIGEKKLRYVGVSAAKGNVILEQEGVGITYALESTVTLPPKPKKTLWVNVCVSELGGYGATVYESYDAANRVNHSSFLVARAIPIQIEDKS
jgi:hypothetical protein